MIYSKGIAIFVPWYDTDGNRNHSRFTFRGEVDRRKVRRHVRAVLKRMGIHVRKEYLRLLIKHRSFEIGD